MKRIHCFLILVFSFLNNAVIAQQANIPDIKIGWAQCEVDANGYPIRQGTYFSLANDLITDYNPFFIWLRTPQNQTFAEYEKSTGKKLPDQVRIFIIEKSDDNRDLKGATQGTITINKQSRYAIARFSRVAVSDVKMKESSMHYLYYVNPETHIIEWVTESNANNSTLKKFKLPYSKAPNKYVFTADILDNKSKNIQTSLFNLISIAQEGVAIPRTSFYLPSEHLNNGTQNANTVSTPTNGNTSTGVNSSTTPAPSMELINAIRQNNYSGAEKLVLGNGVNINGRDSRDGRAAIHYAAVNDDADMINLLKDKGNADLNITDNQGKTALDLALEGSKFKAALALLNNNADASKANAGLDRVLATQNMEILKLMLQNGANGETAIRKSIASDNVETMKFVFENSSARASNALFEEAINKRSTKCAIGLLQNGVDKSQAMDFVVRSRNKDMVDLVLNTGVDVTTANKALTFFVEQRDISKAESAITNNQADASVAMPAAVKSNNAQMVNMLLRNHADPNDQMDEVSAAGNNEIVTAFLTAGANPDNGVKPAADNDKTATLQLLLDNKGDANIAMPIAIKKNNTSMVQMCLTAGKPADVYRSEYMVTACENSNYDILNALLLAGAPADPGLNIAVNKSDIRMVEALVKGGADPNPGLAIAAEKKSVEIVNLLLEKGAQANASAMLAGVKGGVIAIVEKLINKGGSAREPGLLKASVGHDDAVLTTLLIEKGADPKEGVAAAVNQNKPKALAVMVDKGADVKDPLLLRESVSTGFTEIAKILIDKGGADPLYIDDKKIGLLHLAAAKGQIMMFDLLAGYKLDVNAKDIEGNTPLIMAIINREEGQKTKNPGLFLSMVRGLLDKGADPNMVNNNGDAALHLLCKGDMKNSLREDCIEAMLAKGANACLVDKKNNTAREYLPVMEGGPRKKLKNAMKDGDCK